MKLEVWLYEAHYNGCDPHEEMMVHVSDTNVWMDMDNNKIEYIPWTITFYEELGKEDQLTYICDL